MKKYLLVLLLVQFIFAGPWVTVTRVIDGDTFEADSMGTIRLIGIDSPESKHPAKPIQPFAIEAYNYTKKMLEGKRVRLEFDWQEKDKYNRILAYAFLEDGTLFNAKIIEEGYAHAYTQYPFKQEYMDSFVKLEEYARVNEKGLWSTAVVKDTVVQIFKDENNYWLNSNSSVLHNNKCRWYGNTKQGYYTKEIVGRDCGICGGAHRTVSSPEVQSNQSTGSTYWINSSSNVRHNSSCRYYGNTKHGYYTKEKIGKACGICGG